MKTLSFWPSWGWCVLHAGKAIDNRLGAFKHRGPLLLHMSNPPGVMDPGYLDAREYARRIARVELPAPRDLPRGGIVGRADLVDVIPRFNDEIAKRMAEKHGVDLRWWFRDKAGHVLVNVEELPFVQCPGALGLFDRSYLDLKERAERLARRSAAP